MSLRLGRTKRNNSVIKVIDRVLWFLIFSLLCLIVFILYAKQYADADNTQSNALPRKQLSIELSGSLQNPAWGPNGSHSIVFTRFRNGYGIGPADLFIHDLRNNITKPLVADGSDNVNQPGAAWNERVERIAFSSTRDEIDQIYTIRSDGNQEFIAQHTDSASFASYEPSFSPDGQSIVFESHPLGDDGNGIIIISPLGLNSNGRVISQRRRDCRQPNWSPAGDYIVYQCLAKKQWDLWIFDLKGGKSRQLTSGKGDKTDASFSPNGHWIVFSLDNGSYQIGDLHIIQTAGGDAINLTRSPSYEGAPSWSADGCHIVFELTEEMPSKRSKATIWQIALPPHYCLR